MERKQELPIQPQKDAGLKGYDILLWKMVKEGDEVVCAAPFTVPKKLTVKKQKMDVKLRTTGGNFAKMKCKGIETDLVGDKTVGCQGYNIYADRVDGHVGEIKASNFRDVIYENIGKCVHQGMAWGVQRIVPHDILEKGQALMNFCNAALFNLNNDGIIKYNELVPPELRSAVYNPENDKCKNDQDAWIKETLPSIVK